MIYITCEQRKNAPKINVIICEKKCVHAKTCTAYLSYLKTVAQNDSLGENKPEAETFIAVHGSSLQHKPLPAASK